MTKRVTKPCVFGHPRGPGPCAVKAATGWDGEHLRAWRAARLPLADPGSPPQCCERTAPAPDAGPPGQAGVFPDVSATSCEERKPPHLVLTAGTMSRCCAVGAGQAVLRRERSRGFWMMLLVTSTRCCIANDKGDYDNQASGPTVVPLGVSASSSLLRQDNQKTGEARARGHGPRSGRSGGRRGPRPAGFRRRGGQRVDGELRAGWLKFVVCVSGSPAAMTLSTHWNRPPASTSLTRFSTFSTRQQPPP